MLLRRLFGGEEPREGSSAIQDPDPNPEPIEPIRFQAPPAPNAVCPTCGFVLDPPPARDRRCPSCRQPIIVRRADGRIVLLTEGAVAIFDRERQRAMDEAAWTAGREGWLKLAAYVRAPVERRDRIAAAPLSASVVDDARDLYMTNAEKSGPRGPHGETLAGGGANPAPAGNGPLPGSRRARAATRRDRRVPARGHARAPASAGRVVGARRARQHGLLSCVRRGRRHRVPDRGGAPRTPPAARRMPQGTVRLRVVDRHAAEEEGPCQTASAGAGHGDRHGRFAVVNRVGRPHRR